VTIIFENLTLSPSFERDIPNLKKIEASKDAARKSLMRTRKDLDLHLKKNLPKGSQ
jgi:hypothetical protein